MEHLNVMVGVANQYRYSALAIIIYLLVVATVIELCEFNEKKNVVFEAVSGVLLCYTPLIV